MKSANLFRSWLLTLILYSGLLISHLFGGGSFQFNETLIPLILGSLIYFKSRPIQFFKGPDLAMAILVFQGFGHISVNSSQPQSDMKMAISHLFASVLTYTFARNFDQALSAYKALIAYLFPDSSKYFAPTFKFINFEINGLTHQFKSLNLQEVIKERAPPALTCA